MRRKGRSSFMVRLTKDMHAIFFIGLGGVSMSALAAIAHGKGYRVGGSDRVDSQILSQLRAQGIEVFIGHNASNLDGYDTVVYNAAIPRDNPEMVRARADGLQMIYRADFLTALMGEHKNAIGVAGMHGKSTTSAMLSHVFLSADRDPDILIGAQLPELNAAYRVGKTGTDFIFEACEYRDSFLSFRPTTAVVLNVEMDHPDYFKDMEQVCASFHKYLQIPGKSGHAVINADDENAMQCAKGIETPVTTFSLSSPAADFYATNLHFAHGCGRCDVLHNGEHYASLSLSVPGRHNVANALAVIAAAALCGLDGEQITRGLSTFTGAHRRMEYKGTFAPTGAAVYDDFAHHPSEIKTTLAGAKQMGYQRVFVVFQPHTYSRTAALLNDFRAAFSAADQVIFTDIYAAREQNTYHISAADIASGVPGALYLAQTQWAKITQYLAQHTTAQDMILIMGAGDIARYAEKIADKSDAKTDACVTTK